MFSSCPLPRYLPQTSRFPSVRSPPRIRVLPNRSRSRRLGGMQDMGPVQAEKNEPVFHEPWQGRAYAFTRAMGAWRRWNLDASRFQREQIAPLDYFRLSYYERWVVALVELMLKNNMVTPAELESGKPDPGSAKLTPPLTADKVPILTSKGVPARRDLVVTARFHAGERVRARHINPVGHT